MSVIELGMKDIVYTLGSDWQQCSQDHRGSSEKTAKSVSHPETFFLNQNLTLNLPIIFT